MADKEKEELDNSAVPDLTEEFLTDREQEKKWIRAAQEGDHESFGELVSVYQGRLRAYAARYLYDANDVYDVVQDAFLNAYRNIQRFDPEKPFWPWIRTICRNRTLNFFRSRKNMQSKSVSIFEDSVQAELLKDEEDTGDTEQQIKLLRECIQALPPANKELIYSRYHLRIPVKDIAKEYGQSPAAISMKLMRIRGHLRKCMQKKITP